ncbi:MAG: TonB-dependent receptor [Cyanobacteria bacterium QH_7_48_89]|nr:MAG: TonB-dependent receptor [Cyanobacteria bacterium QH_7_48_89]
MLPARVGQATRGTRIAIRRLRFVNHQNHFTALLLAGAASVLVAPAARADAIPVTGVQLNPTDAGFEVILDTPNGVDPRVLRTQFGNTLALDILNARLQIPEGEALERDTPTAGIASVEVVQQSPNSVRVLVTGTETVPNVEIVESETGLAVAVNTRSPVAEPPAEAESSAPPSGEEPIELVVTATRTEERQEDVPRSVTVIEREQIEEQSNQSDNLPDILGKLVPGLGPPTQSTSTRTQSLRGRQPSILIDGVPLNTNRRDFQSLRSIDPSAIERVEVVRGPSAVFGSQATGGVINIITRQPTDEPFTASTSVFIGPNFSLSDPSESFGGGIEQYISGQVGKVDYTLTGSFEETGNSFDAEGDLIPVGRSQGLDQLQTLNLFGKVGVDIDKQQRLQLSVNYFDDEQDNPTLPDPIVNQTPEREKAIALDVGDFEIDKLPGREETVVNLNYSNDDLSGSQLQLQAFFQDSTTRTIPRDNRNTVFQSVSRTAIKSEKIGTRLEVETPLFENANLLWGADYIEESIDNPLTIFDPETFDESGRTEFDDIDEAFFAPPYDLNTLGLFAQLQWEPVPRLALNGGLRFEQFDLSADDYNVLGSIELPPRLGADESIEGGEVSFDDLLFNIGAVYDLTDKLSAFANFAQGFSAPDFGRILRFPQAEGFSVSESVNVNQPVVVDNYELGLRGNWDNVQLSLAGFFTYSELGNNVRQSQSGPFLELERSPTRTYGIEAAIDYQPSQKWQLGTSVTWVEGESNPQNNEEGFIALSTREIQPLKVFAYVENQTLPNWRNRLQLLVVGSRNEAFEVGVDEFAIDSYTLVSYISNLSLGPGTLTFGIQNILDNQYFPVDSQLQDENSRYAAGLGRTFNLEYEVSW